MKNYFLRILFVCLTTCCFSQESIQFIGTRESLPFHLAKVDSTGIYFVASNFADGNEKGSALYKWEDNSFNFITFVYSLSDSLICNQIVDLWAKNGQLYILTYAQNAVSQIHYIVLSKLDELSGEIEVIDSSKFELWKVVNTWHVKDLIIEGERNFIFYEHFMTNATPKAIAKVRIVDENIEIIRYFLPDNFNETFLWDSYYDSLKEEYILNIGKFLYVFDKGFLFKSFYPYNAWFGNSVYSDLQRMILGNNMNNFQLFERFRNQAMNNSILMKRTINYEDSIYLNQNALAQNLHEDCYFVKKIIKEKYNYLFYSRSTVGGFDNNYGFTILVLDKKGTILNQHEIKIDRPCLLNDLDIDENQNFAYGILQYWDNAEQVAFKLDLKDDTAESQEPYSSENKVILLYLNSTKNTFRVSPHIGINGTLILTDILGRFLSRSSIDNDIIDYSHLPSGMYVVYFLGNNITLKQKIILFH